jgi:hypothetical protein
VQDPALPHSLRHLLHPCIGSIGPTRRDARNNPEALPDDEYTAADVCGNTAAATRAFMSHH